MYAPSPTMPNSGHPQPEGSSPESNSPRPPPQGHPARPAHPHPPIPLPKAPRICDSSCGLQLYRCTSPVPGPMMFGCVLVRYILFPLAFRTFLSRRHHGRKRRQCQKPRCRIHQNRDRLLSAIATELKCVDHRPYLRADPPPNATRTKTPTPTAPRIHGRAEVNVSVTAFAVSTIPLAA